MDSILASKISLYSAALIYFLAGAYHFINPKVYLKIMPAWFPAKEWLNWLSGLAEIVLAVGLLFPQTRTLAAYGLVALLVSFFAVHVGHLFEPPVIKLSRTSAVDFTRKPTYYGLFVRLALQFFLIYWAWQLRLA